MVAGSVSKVGNLYTLQVRIVDVSTSRIEEVAYEDVSGIEQILRGEEEVLEGKLFSYDPAGRRDPFRSLLEGFEEMEEGPAQARPPGLPGMMIGELRLEGIIETPSGILAFVLGRDNVSYIIRPGTKLYNGEVAEIQPKKVVFRQDVNDPNRRKQYEEVVREITD